MYMERRKDDYSENLYRLKDMMRFVGNIWHNCFALICFEAINIFIICIKIAIKMKMGELILRFQNCALSKVKECFGQKRIIFFGKGSWLSMVNHTELMELQKQFVYIIDNNPSGQGKLGDVILNVYTPDKLMEESECIVVLTSPVYMYDMYCQLEQMHLSDRIECYAFPFMQLVAVKQLDDSLLLRVIDRTKKSQIPKIIHSFWFSGDEKPEEYQKCVDTWAENLSEYEIIEWNLNNYNWHKHPFVERAIELKAWAFASDFARLDVLSDYGGIYLDMDVEVFKPFNDLLGNEAIFSFANNVLIDLAVVGAKKHNFIIQKLLKIYDIISQPQERKDFTRLFQPALVRPTLAEQGIRMDGSLQVVDGATVFPMEFFMPQDVVLYNEYERTEHTYCVHHDNFGWSIDTNNKQKKKKHDNNLLWNHLKY